MRFRMVIAFCAALFAFACRNEATGRIQSGADDAAPPESLTIGMPSGTASSEPLADTDVDFVMTMARAGMHEVNAGTLAAERATTDEVRAFATRTTDDHRLANQELAALAQSKNLGLPVEVDVHAADVEKKLSGLSGIEFDRAYIVAMLDDHSRTLKIMNDTVATTRDPQIKDFATNMLPILEEHRNAAQRIALSLMNG